jgi:HD-GYP domain-containing protein (c-di-GMP phosphodiesterase class II)
MLVSEDWTEAPQGSRFGRGPGAGARAAPSWIEGAVAGLTVALELYDGHMAGHAEEVSELARRVGGRLGMSETELRELDVAARLHDVGKIAVDTAILQKAGPLVAAEWVAMQRHPLAGASALAGIPGLERAAAMVRSHHERWDGLGYPDGLAGEEIPLGGRILAACDAYRAMVEPRPYRISLSPSEAAAELEAESGSHFDPAVVDAMLQVLA